MKEQASHVKTDRQLQEDVMAELAWDRSVDSACIGVEVEEGIVTLSGHVGSCAEKGAAESAAQRVGGVRGVVLDLDVVLPGIRQRTDEQIAKIVRDALEWSVVVPRDRIKVRVEDGWVTLSGNVDWAYVRDAADSSVRTLVGIKGVIDKIEIRPPMTSDDIKTHIEAALQRRAHSDIRAIQISVDQGTVTLSGFVDSLAERHSMEHAAWNTPGVRDVVDKLEVRLAIN